MGVVAHVAPLAGALPRVEYRWDPDTDILTGAVTGAKRGNGLTGTVGLEGMPGGFVVIDLEGGAIRGIDVVDWPEQVDTIPDLAPPGSTQDVTLTVPARASQPGIAAVELDAAFRVEKNADESVIHIRLGNVGNPTVARVADNLFVEVDASTQLVGLWFLNVPPFPDLDA